MATINDFFTSLSTGTKWSAGVSFTRLNGLPIDDASVFNGYTALTNYINDAASTAYMGQIVAVIDGGITTVYVLAPTETIEDEETTVTLAPQALASGGNTEVLATQLSTLAGKIGDIKTDEKGNPVYDDIAAWIEAVEVEVAKKQDKLTAENAGSGIIVTPETTDSESGDTIPASIAVKISATEGNSLSTKEDGLYVEVPEVVHPEYTIAKEASTPDGLVAQYKLTKDNVPTGVTIDIPEVDVPEYTIVKKETATEGYLATYALQKDNVDTGATIDIPKEFFVKSGEVVLADDDFVTANAGTEKDKYYIVLTINTPENDGTEQKIVIPAESLVDALNVDNTGKNVELAYDASTNTLSAKVIESGITATELANNAVTTDKILDGAVKTAKIDDKAVTTGKINDAAVTEEKINDDAVTTDKIKDGNVTYAKLESSIQDAFNLVNNSTNGSNKFLTEGDKATAVDTTNGDKLVTASQVITYVSTMDHDDPAYGAIAENATNDTWAGSKDVYDGFKALEEQISNAHAIYRYQ